MYTFVFLYVCVSYAVQREEKTAFILPPGIDCAPRWMSGVPANAIADSPSSSLDDKTNTN